jgi:crotonobetaine/carnitine-CoA ligase
MMRDVRTLGGLLEARAAVAPDRPFVTFESGAVTFGEIDHAANRVANALAALGLQPGDRAAAMLSNRPEYLATWFGMTKAGVIEVPLNTGLRGDLLAYMLAHSGAKLLVIEERWVDRLEAIRAGLPELEHVVVVGDGPLTLDQLLEAPDTPPGLEVSPYDPSVILFTSGTTGRSKGALLTHNANIRGAVNTCDLMGYAAGETFFNAFPLFHINARYTTVVPALVLDDARAVLHDRFTASGFWDIVRA